MYGASGCPSTELASRFSMTMTMMCGGPAAGGGAAWIGAGATFRGVLAGGAETPVPGAEVGCGGAVAGGGLETTIAGGDAGAAVTGAGITSRGPDSAMDDGRGAGGAVGVQHPRTVKRTAPPGARRRACGAWT